MESYTRLKDNLYKFVLPGSNIYLSFLYKIAHMGSVKTILRILAAVFVLTWFILFIAGYSDAAGTMLVIAIFSILLIIGLQLSSFYHGYFLKRRRM